MSRTWLGTPMFSPARWRAVAAVFAALLALFGSTAVLAQAVGVPASVQAEVLSKLVSYDRNLASRAGKTVRILLVKNSSARSGLAATVMKAALERLESVGGLPHQETIVRYDGAVALAKLCREERAAIVYITPDFDSEIDALRAALTGVDVLSVSAEPSYVPRGIVLGFEFVSSKPKLVLNLNQAKQQNINFKADVLSLMKVYR